MQIALKGVYSKTKKLASGRVMTYYYHRATKQRLPDDPQSPAFFAALANVKAKPCGKAPAERTVAHLVREYRASVQFAELKPSTQSEYKRHLKRIEKALGEFAVTSIKRAHVTELSKKFVDRPTTARAVTTVVKLLFSHAVEELGWIESNPFLGMNRRKKSTDTGQAPYSETQIATFRATHPYGTRARLVFEIGLGTANRISDIVRLPASAMSEKTFPLLTTKTAELVHVPITTEMRRAWVAWLETLRARGVTEVRVAVCHEDGREMHKRTLSKEMAAAYTAAGFETSQRTHALRYTACVRLIENGFSFEDVAEHTGHRLATMAAKYCAKRRKAEERRIHLDKLDGHDDPGDERGAIANTSGESAQERLNPRSSTLPLRTSGTEWSESDPSLPAARACDAPPGARDPR